MTNFFRLTLSSSRISEIRLIVRVFFCIKTCALIYFGLFCVTAQAQIFPPKSPTIENIGVYEGEITNIDMGLSIIVLRYYIDEDKGILGRVTCFLNDDTVIQKGSQEISLGGLKEGQRVTLTCREYLFEESKAEKIIVQ